MQLLMSVNSFPVFFILLYYTNQVAAIISWRCVMYHISVQLGEMSDIGEHGMLPGLHPSVLNVSMTLVYDRFSPVPFVSKLFTQHKVQPTLLTYNNLKGNMQDRHCYES